MIYDDIQAVQTWPGFKQYFADALTLEAVILEAGDGDYLEIGVRKGGSAIFVGLIKRLAKQSGNIYGIDLMAPDMARKGVSPEVVARNAAAFGVSVNLVVANSNPWPLPEDIRPVVALIDGDHHYEPCLADWNNLRPRTKRFVLFHDCNNKDVGRVVDIAKCDPEWRLVGTDHKVDGSARHTHGRMAVFERCESS